MLKKKYSEMAGLEFSQNGTFYNKYFWAFFASSNEHTTKATTSIFLCQTRDFNTQMIGIIWSASKHREGRLWVKGGEGLWLISLVVSAAMMEVRESMKITT